MREGWKIAEIGQYCNVLSSKRVFASDYVEKGIPFYRSKEIIHKALGVFSGDEVYISEKRFFDFKNKYGAPIKGDILLSSVGNRSGIAYYVKEDYDFYFKDGNLIWMKDFSTELSSKYLEFYLRSELGEKAIDSMMIGAAQKALTIEGVKKIKINFPPIQTQRKIASILSGYDDLIANNLKRIKILEEMAQQTYEEWFVRMRFPGYETAVMNEETGLPEGWEKEIASELFKITIGKTPPRGEDVWFNSDEIENRIKWMSISDIRKSNVFLYDTKETLTNEAIRKFNFNIIKKGSVALSFKLTVGLVTIASEDMTTNEAIAHFNEGKICNSYTYFYLKNFDYNSLGSTSSIGTAINSKIVKIIPFLKPTSKILTDFDSIVKPLLNSINNINRQNQRLRESRDILLPRLMMGMIEV